MLVRARPFRCPFRGRRRASQLVARLKMLRLALRSSMVAYSRGRQSVRCKNAIRTVASSARDGKETPARVSHHEPPPASSKEPTDAFEKGLPFLFRNNATLPTMVTLLCIIFAYNAFSDRFAPAEVDEIEAHFPEEVVKVSHVCLTYPPATVTCIACLSHRALLPGAT